MTVVMNAVDVVVPIVVQEKQDKAKFEATILLVGRTHLTGVVSLTSSSRSSLYDAKKRERDTTPPLHFLCYTNQKGNKTSLQPAKIIYLIFRLSRILCICVSVHQK